MYPRKLCKVCHLFKLYNPSEKLQSKACGFVGKVCWDCHVANQTLRLQGKSPLYYPVPDELIQVDTLQEAVRAFGKQITRILGTKAGLKPDAPAELERLLKARDAKRQELYDLMQRLAA